ncbi:MAG: hypothetical protein EPO32_03125 [Anaerolineae bacterium]|nr:MAG: hypothetical protein EPO32_03125 [Anaerolineae bacterium]
MIFVSMLAAVGFVAYQAGAAQGIELDALVIGPLSIIGLFCLSGVAFMMFMGSMVFVFCPFRKFRRTNSQEFDV